jgi:hypothetical protein
VLQVLAHAGCRCFGSAGRRTAASSDGRTHPRRRPAGRSARRCVGTAWAVEPPTVRLAAGVHQGPLVLDHAQTVIGEPGAIVRGGILITADDVTVRNVTVRGGEYGIEVDGADSVELDDVVVEGAELDGINVAAARSRSATARSAPCRRPTRRGSTSRSASTSTRASSSGAR